MLAIPDVRQRDNYDCGPACVKSVEQFYGRNRPLVEYVAGLVASPTEGTDPRTVERYLRGLGYCILSGEMTVDLLRHFTDKDWPVIVLTTGHYVVARGVARGRVYVQDPDLGPRSIKSEDFAKAWEDHDRVETFHRWGIAVWLP